MQRVAHQTSKIELDTELSGPCALFLQRRPIGPDPQAPRWLCRGVDEFGHNFHGEFRRVDELVAFLRAVDGTGAPADAN